MSEYNTMVKCVTEMEALLNDPAYKDAVLKIADTEFILRTLFAIIRRLDEVSGE